MKVKHVDVQVIKSPEHDNKYQVTELEVVAENELYLVLNDTHFTTLRKTKKEGSELNKVINDHSISVWDMGYASLDGIHYTEYTTKAVDPEKIKGRIEQYVEKKYGYLFKVDLGFIK